MLDQKELSEIARLLYQNGAIIERKCVIIGVSTVLKILEKFLNQLPENTENVEGDGSNI